MNTILVKDERVVWLHTDYRDELKSGMIQIAEEVPEPENNGMDADLRFDGNKFYYVYTEKIPEVIPDEQPLPKQVPEKITARQLKSALILSGLSLSTIDSIIRTLPHPQQDLAMVDWEYSTNFYRNNTMINQIAGALKLTSQKVDEIFILGATLIND